MLSCILYVNDTPSEIGFIETDTFTPEPPMILGQAVLYNGSQVRNSYLYHYNVYYIDFTVIVLTG